MSEWQRYTKRQKDAVETYAKKNKIQIVNDFMIKEFLELSQFTKESSLQNYLLISNQMEQR